MAHHVEASTVYFVDTFYIRIVIRLVHNLLLPAYGGAAEKRAELGRMTLFLWTRRWLHRIASAPARNSAGPLKQIVQLGALLNFIVV